MTDNTMSNATNNTTANTINAVVVYDPDEVKKIMEKVMTVLNPDSVLCLKKDEVEQVRLIDIIDIAGEPFGFFNINQANAVSGELEAFLKEEGYGSVYARCWSLGEEPYETREVLILLERKSTDSRKYSFLPVYVPTFHLHAFLHEITKYVW